MRKYQPTSVTVELDNLWKLSADTSWSLYIAYITAKNKTFYVCTRMRVQRSANNQRNVLVTH